MIIKIGKRFSGIEINGDKMKVEAGALLSAAARAAAEASLSGLECESGIPGSYGGAVYMNAGAYGGEIKDVAVSTRYLSAEGEICTITGDEHKFGYRKSIFTENGGIVLSGELQLRLADKEEILGKMSELSKKRKEKQKTEG